MTPSFRIKSTSQSDADRAVATVVAAFASDPAVRWMYPAANQYLDHFPDFVRAFGGEAFECGTADCLDNFRGVALWLPPNVQPDDAAVVEVLQRSVEEERLPEMFSLFELMGEFHPHQPHWYLPLIGVDPSVQERGSGSALLQHALKRCDRDGLPAYLEATSPRNASLYERFGFKPRGVIQTQTSPPIISMLREPNPPADRHAANTQRVVQGNRRYSPEIGALRNPSRLASTLTTLR